MLANRRLAGLCVRAVLHRGMGAGECRIRSGIASEARHQEFDYQQVMTGLGQGNMPFIGDMHAVNGHRIS